MPVGNGRHTYLSPTYIVLDMSAKHKNVICTCRCLALRTRGDTCTMYSSAATYHVNIHADINGSSGGSRV